MREPLENLPACDGMRKVARDGHVYCIRKAKNVELRDCRQCDARPRSMYLKGKR